MDKELYISGVDGKFRLLFTAEGILRSMPAEELYYQVSSIDDSFDGFKDMYNKVSCAVYIGSGKDFVVFEGSDDENGCEVDMPRIEDMAAFIDGNEDIVKALNCDAPVIIHVSKIAGTTADYTLIRDDELHDEIIAMNPAGIIGTLNDYEDHARSRVEGSNSYKYAQIIDGIYQELS